MKRFFILLALSLFIAFPAFADTAPADQPSEYLFHLFLNSSGQLVLDHDFKFPYDIVSQAFSQTTVGQFPDSGEVISLTGAVAARFAFDVHSGKVSIYAPYAADGQKVIFYDNQHQSLLTVPVSDSSFCNDDGICNADRGEDSLTCSKDCAQVTLPAASVAPVAAAASSSSGLLASIIYLLAGVILLGGIWWFFKRRQSGSLPPSSMPTPPAPPSTNNPV